VICPEESVRVVEIYAETLYRRFRLAAEQIVAWSNGETAEMNFLWRAKFGCWVYQNEIGGQPMSCC
jgi:hypothetical protein